MDAQWPNSVSLVLAMTKSSLTKELLAEPARLAARTLARLHLLKVLEESARIVMDDDPEAVHDFRVALRRLRSWLQAFRPLLDDTVTRRSEQTLRRLSRVAGEARDLQVQGAALRELAGTGTGKSALAMEAGRIERRLTRDEVRARKKLIQRTVDDLQPSGATLATQLQHAELTAGSTVASAQPTMAAAMALLLVERLDQMQTGLSRLKRPGQRVLAHQARIATKRLRYLLEAFGSSSRLAATAVLRLTKVQDEFGRLHDAQMLLQRITGLHAKPVLRTRLRRNIRTIFREAQRLSGSRDIATAEDATTRLVRRLETRG